MRAVWELPMRAIDTTNKKTITHTAQIFQIFAYLNLLIQQWSMIIKVTTGEQFETRKEAKERVGGKWAFERLVKNGEIRFIKDGNNIASDGLHYPKQGNRSLS